MNLIQVDFNQECGKLKPVHGITNGPLFDNEDLSPLYKEVGVPYVRLHDAGGAGDGGRTLVDISRIFTNFDADENDPKSYLFQHTDQLLLAIHSLEAKTIYRLGESIDHSVYNRYARPPKDFEKWARICINIIRHYNDGWADGLHLGIEYWEIWNEAEGIPKMWNGGTKEQAFELYRVSSKAIKAYNPKLKIGGMAFWYYYDHEYPHDYPREFIEFCAVNGLDLDFISYHMYSDKPQTVRENSERCHEDLLKYGFPKTEIVLDEWNYLGLERPFEGSIWELMGHGFSGSGDSHKVYKEVYENIKGMVGASFCLACMMEMNQSSLDIATYYDGQPKSHVWCGWLDQFYDIQKTYYAFKAYGEVYKSGACQVKSQVECKGIYALAAKAENKAYVLLANYRGESGSYELCLSGLKTEKIVMEVYLLNEEFDLELQKVEELSNSAVTQVIYLENYSVTYIVIQLDE